MLIGIATMECAFEYDARIDEVINKHKIEGKTRFKWLLVIISNV